MAENNSNGNVKWKTAAALFLTLVGIMVGIFTWGVNQVSAVEQRSITRDEALSNCIHSYIIPMKEQIAAISAKLGVH